MPSEARYSLDTSSLVAAWRERYPIENFPSFWERLERLIETGGALASTEVLRELKRRDADLYAWFKQHEKMFVEIDDGIQQAVIEIMGKYPKFVDERTGKSAGDPFVIALAMKSSPPLIVVTEEGLGSENRPTIPLVCGREKLPCINLLQLIKEQNWII